jgi:CPA2 family monovalent cation:H+ antiporter-2
VLAKYLIPHDEIEKLVTEIRSDGYQMFRSLSTSEFNPPHLSVNIPQVDIHSIHVRKGSEAEGKTIDQLKLNYIEGLSLLALSQEGNIKSRPEDGLTLKENNILFFLGQGRKFNEIRDLFREKES